MEEYIRQQSRNLVIHKIRYNIQITQSELDELERMLFEQGELGTREEFVKAYGEQPLGRFVRSIVGLDANAAKLAFGEVLGGLTLNSRQIRFMDTIINYLNVKGIIEPDMLFEPPFTEIDTNGIMGVFDHAYAQGIVSMLEGMNRSAEVG